jgi:hypothetical protein
MKECLTTINDFYCGNLVSCKISDFHDNENEYESLLGYSAL